MLPDAEEVPVDYVAGPSAPGEGVHWIDLTSGEFNGQTFDQTFIYGSYDGDMIFYEPMITLDFLEGLASSDEPEAIYPIKQPDRVGIAGWYPRYYKISYSTHKKEFVISLIDFYYRD